MTAQNKSTQHFTEILDIQENVVMLSGGNACLLIEVQSVNFALLSAEEQNAKVYAYAALLNSLSFPIQIIVRSKKIDIQPYLQSLQQAATSTHNEKLAQNITMYKEFVEKLVTQTTVLDKQFYIVIAYNSLEEGVGGVQLGSHMHDFFIKAKASLNTKAESLLTQIERMGIRARVLERDNLVRVFHDIYNESNQGVKDISSNHLATKGGM